MTEGRWCLDNVMRSLYVGLDRGETNKTNKYKNPRRECT